jgi:endogenous inhibitor of DNA gyrase (YacG/DUF329 family)
MEATVGYSEQHPNDRFEEARQLFKERKNQPRVTGGRGDRRDDFMLRLEEYDELRRQRKDRVYCPECQGTYLRSTVAHHRRRKHGYQPSRVAAKWVSYTPSLERRFSTKVICPECRARVPEGNVSAHRRDQHGVVSPRGIHQNYERIVEEI